MKKEKTGTMNIILLVSAITLAVFTVIMLFFYMKYQSVPDTLIYAVFGALTGEAGIMGWIKTRKEKYKDREWELEDKENDISPTDEETES